MWTFNDLFVLSNLYLASGKNAADEWLADLLRWVRTETNDSVIVLAGDVLDLLTVSDCPSQYRFNRTTCHVKQIIEHHPDVFDALARLAQSPRHTLVIMSGECDAELIVPEARETIERRLGFTSPNGMCWFVSGDALRVQVGAAVALVEHGNGLDPWNRSAHDSLQVMLALASRNLPEPREYKAPLGVELTTSVIVKMREQYPWLRYLRPVNESSLPLLWPLASKLQQDAILKLVERYESMRIEAALKKQSNSHDPILLFQGDKEADRTPQDKIFKEWIDGLYDQQSSKDDLQGKARSITNRDSWFDFNQPPDTARYLQPLFDCGADLIIHGHTHAPRICALEGGLYMDTGTWNQLLPFPKSTESKRTWEDFLEQLRTNRIESFSRPTFAHVHQRPAQSWPTAELVEWQAGGPETLAAHSLPNSPSHKEIPKWTS